MACSVEYDKIQTFSGSETPTRLTAATVITGASSGVVGINGGGTSGMAGAHETRDAFEWDDSCYSVDSSEMDQVRDSLFEAMRSG